MLRYITHITANGLLGLEIGTCDGYLQPVRKPEVNNSHYPPLSLSVRWTHLLKKIPNANHSPSIRALEDGCLYHSLCEYVPSHRSLGYIMGDHI